MTSAFNFNRAYAIAKKETFHILRDPFTLTLAFLLPVMMVIIFGYAMEFNVKEIPTAFLDLDKTQSSRIFLQAMGSSNYFKLDSVASPASGLKKIEEENAKAFVYIPPNFEKHVLSGHPENIQVLADGTDNTFVAPIVGYLSQINAKAIQKVTGYKINPPIETKTRYLFNPELNSQWFSVPGIAVVIMAILCSLLTTLTIAREWENGSMELLLSTPVKPLEIILGKLTPYAALCLSAVALVYAFARLWFGLPFVGSHFVFLLGCLLFLIAYLALGLTISVIIRNQLTAMQAGMIAGMIPSALLSGFIFPIKNMPELFQYLTSVLPARWFMLIARDQFLKGTPLNEQLTPIAILFVIALFLVIVALKNFKKDLE